MKFSLILSALVITQLGLSVQAQTSASQAKPAAIAQDAAPRTQSIVGLPNDLDALETYGVFTLDNITAASILYSSKDMRDEPGAAQNLWDGPFTYGQFSKTAEKKIIQSERQKCGKIRQEFARKDCLVNLMSMFSAYGKKINKGQYINIPHRGIVEWDDARKQISLSNSSVAEMTCNKDAVCLSVGSYGAGNNMLCYQLDATAPSDWGIPLDEGAARDLSQRAGGSGIRGLKPSVFLQVTEVPKALPEARMCADGRSGKVVAEGKAILKYQVLWSPRHAEYAHDFQPPKKSAPAGKVLGKVAPLAPEKLMPGQTAPANVAGKINLKVN